ncbi:organic hydroperoxide resistance protein [Plantactinospora endophytica]|uniref:Organic hydroperoxide resistance protein/OsmC-like protein n=1 Tax=Plantactinospora endophytica TaxID=673535 RepID=A0ABQ4E5P3_9ACTN|nr:organic hydroperoxide resistance protein [Plantactinospora endophytica]GIG90004.1 putative organic hydroperoxide resistance protein/OsmC-like protein [Plantactinospora endophytica]
MRVLYTAQARSTGEGRDGHVATSDGILALDLAAPKEMGGEGGATNPEQLFAAGYAACFHSALKLLARRDKVDVAGSSVTADVGLGRTDSGGFGLTVTLNVEVPGLDPETVRELTAKAHELCPYSNAVRGNVDVTLTVAGDANG